MNKKLDTIIEHLQAMRTTLERMNDNLDGLREVFRQPNHDEIYPMAKALATKAGYASAGLFQRVLHVGYIRAARLMYMLEENKVIGPADGTKPREVLIKPPSDSDDENLNA